MRRATYAAWGLAATALALMLVAGLASAHEVRCDFLTGGGFIIRDSGAKANFGVGGGCKHGSPTWGHLEYHDHGTGLNVHWTSITGYFFRHQDEPPAKQPTGSRYICGTARTNQFGDVDWAVLVQDSGEPGVDDLFIIRLTQGGVIVYTTEHDADHTLGGPGPGGGNIQLHKPNPSTTGEFGGTCAAFPLAEG
jgi:hypothetical protein